MIHVYPLNDEKPHDLQGTMCPCNPKLDWTYPEAIVTHNAWDCREFVEQAEAILNAGEKA